MKPRKYIFSIEGSEINGLFVLVHEWSTGLLLNEKELKKYRQNILENGGFKMKKIRRGVFETNSSSSHSLVFIEVKKEIKAIQENNKEYILGTGEYGWGPETLTEWLEKADYFAIEAINDEKKEELLVNVLLEVYPNAIFRLLEDDDDCGHIDHQSLGDLWDEVLASENPAKKLKEIIFGDSKIEVDNDDH